MSLPGRFLEIGGQRIFYHRARLDQGQRLVQPKAAPLVLLHGFGSSHWEWRQVIPALSVEHDVVALDLPGFGESDRPSPARFAYDAPAYLEAMIGALDELGIERASLMGHALGGGIALLVAARRPERVDRLVLVAPLVYPHRLPPEGMALLLPLVGPVLFRTLYTRGLLRRTLAQAYRDPALVTDDWVDYLWERINRPGGFEAAQAALRFVARPDPIAAAVRAVRAPALIVWGESDHVLPLAAARRLATDLVGSQLAIVPACGHSPAEEKPDELCAAVLPFLGAAERARRGAVLTVPS